MTDSPRSCAFCKCEYIFSITTILSSTTRPIAMNMPPSVRMFKEMSKEFITSSVIRIDSGIETRTIKVMRIFRRNSRMTSAASSAPVSPSCTIPLMEELTSSEVS
ncbi:hypothetical protein D3C77_418240 [compost metagenome]